MKAYKYLPLLLSLLALSFIFFLFHLQDKKNSEDRKLHITYDIEEIYDTRMPQRLRKLFDFYAKLKPKENWEDWSLANNSYMEPYLHSVKAKFIVAYLRKIEDDRACAAPSYQLGIYIFPPPADPQMWIVSIYKADNGEYDICYVNEYNADEFKEEVNLLWKKFRRYWL